MALRRLFLVTGSLQGGGAERQFAEMANYWAATGFDVTLATWTGPEVPDFYFLDPAVQRVHLGVRVSRTRLVPRVFRQVRRALKLRKLFLLARPHAALSFITESNVLTILAGTGLGIRIVISERVQPARDTTLPLAWRLLREFVYSRSDAIVVQTRGAAKWIERRCRKVPSVIPNALRPLPQPMHPRELLIVAVGRLEKQKGFDLLLHAFASIAHDYRAWRVAILGEGSERANLVRLRDKLTIADRVEFLGQVRDVESWMARAGLVVQPSRFEGFPNAILESMGMGAAVVSTDCEAGPGELIEDRVNGRLVPVDDIPALAAVMAELMGQPDVRARLGREALKVRQRFQRDEIMRLWERALLPAVSTKQSLRTAGK